MPTTNNAIIYKDHPREYPEDGKHLAFEQRPFDLEAEAAALQPDELLTENLYVSIDPYQRGRMRPETKKSYSPPFKIGEPLANQGVARVLKSNNASFPEGTLVYGMLDWAEHSRISAPAAKMFKPLVNKYDLPLAMYVGALGMPGMTAYSSLYEIGKPKKGETIFISAASGAVGQLVGQLARREGLRVVGSAGSDDKVKYLVDSLKFDAAFNYKTEKPADALAKYCPAGIDIYFENVGGETLDAVLVAANPFCRIIACGMISQYNAADSYGVKNLINVVAKRLTIRGFIVSDPDFWPKYAAEFYPRMEELLHNKEIIYQLDVTKGLEHGASAFIGMLKGHNFGKALIEIKAP